MVLHALKNNINDPKQTDVSAFADNSLIARIGNRFSSTALSVLELLNTIALRHSRNRDQFLDYEGINQVWSNHLWKELRGFQYYTVVTLDYTIDSGAREDRWIGVNAVGNLNVTFPDNPMDGRLIYVSRFDGDPAVIVTLIPGAGDAVDSPNLPIGRHAAYRYIAAFNIWTLVPMNYITKYSVPNSNDNAFSDGDIVYWDSTIDGLVVARNELGVNIAPTKNDDSTQGFVAGLSKWHRIDTAEIFVCVDNTPGNAIWSLVNNGIKDAIAGPGLFNLTKIGTYHVSTAAGLTTVNLPSIAGTGIAGAITLKRVGANALVVTPDPAEGIESIVIGGSDGLFDGESVKYVPFPGLGRWKRFT